MLEEKPILFKCFHPHTDISDIIERKLFFYFITYKMEVGTGAKTIFVSGKV